MKVTDEHRKAIERGILNTIVLSLEQNRLKEEDLPHIADFVLAQIDRVKNHGELIQFLKELSDKWPIFDQLEEVEKGEVREQVEEEIEKKVLTLAKNGKVEEAIQMAKTMIAK